MCGNKSVFLLQNTVTVGKKIDMSNWEKSQEQKNVPIQILTISVTKLFS